MPRSPRKYLDTTFFHIMTQGIDRNYIFEEPVDIKVYIKNMYLINEKYNIKIIAYCIMNNHTHMLLETTDLKNLSKYMQSLNTRYGKYYNKKYNRVGYVFRDRYKAEGIYSEEQLYNCINYIYNNPVKAGICKRAEEYSFSNYRKINIKSNEDYIFIDIDEDKNELCKEIIEKFLKQNKIEMKGLRESKDELRELIKLLKGKYNISFRTISKNINMGRESIRKEYYK